MISVEAVMYVLDVSDFVMCDVATNELELLCTKLYLAVETSLLISSLVIAKYQALSKLDVVN